MLIHIVLFRPKRDVSDADRQTMFDALHAAAREIPTVRRFHIGSRVTHGSAYEKLMTEDLPFAAIVEFDDLAGRRTSGILSTKRSGSCSTNCRKRRWRTTTRLGQD